MSTVKMIKSDAQISITFGTAFIQRLQSLLLHLTEEHAIEDLKKITEHLQNEEELPEPWMQHIHTVIYLLREIENAAAQTNQVIESDVDNITTQ